MPEDSDKVIPLLEQAIPARAALRRAHAMIALCYHNRYLRGGLKEETRAAASSHARTALASGRGRLG